MQKQRELIHGGDWDTLLLLDACRYDYLKDEYSEFLDGEIKEVKSPSFETSSWLWKNFGNGTGTFDDIIYISANPYVNTKGIETERFNARGKFHKVVSARKHWDEETQTVLPEDVSRLVRKYRMKYPSKKIIAHYMQPHYPFLSLGPIDGLRNPDEDENLSEKGLIDSLFKKITVFTQRHLGAKGWCLEFGLAQKLLGIEPHVVERVGKRYGDEKLREAYRENLDIVLDDVSRLIDRLPSQEKTIVTADHGYLLGEDGEHAHMAWSNSDILYQVPWLEVDNS